jgi:hypothetical protein
MDVKKKTYIYSYLGETRIYPTYADSTCRKDRKTGDVIKHDSARQGWIFLRAGYEKGLVPTAFPIFKSRT